MASTPPSDWVPCVVKQGDTLTSLAAQSATPRDDIWSYSKNTDLATTRTNPDVLLPGDVIYLPASKDQKPIALKTGTTNSFVAPVQLMPIQVKVAEFAGASYTAVADATQLDPKSVGSDGMLALSVPTSTTVVEVTFTSPDGLVYLLVGHLDPIQSPSGRRQRLQNLGWVVPEPGYFDVPGSSSGGQDDDGAVDDGGSADDTGDDSDDDDTSPDGESGETDDTGDGTDDDASSDGGSDEPDPDYGGPVDLGADDDGRNDHGLRRALALYQEANKLPPTGEPDDATLAQLEKDHGL